MEFFEILSGPFKDIWGWILRFWPRSVLSDYEKSALSLKNVRQTSVWQIVSNFWFKLCFLCIFFRVTPNFYVVVCMVDFFQPSLNWWVFLSIYSGIPLISQPWRHIGVTYSKRPWYSVYPKIPTLLFHHHRVSKSFYISQAGSYIYQCITLQTHFDMHINVILKKNRETKQK